MDRRQIIASSAAGLALLTLAAEPRRRIPSGFPGLSHSHALVKFKLVRESADFELAGRDLAFADRDEIAAIVVRTQKQGGGVRTMFHELAGSLFQTR